MPGLLALVTAPWQLLSLHATTAKTEPSTLDIWHIGFYQNRATMESLKVDELITRWKAMKPPGFEFATAEYKPAA